MTINTKTLSELADIYYGESPAGIKIGHSGIPIFGTGGLVGYARKPLFETEAIIVGRKGTLGNPIYTTGKFWAIDTTYAVIAKDGNNTKWLYYSLLNFGLDSLNEATGVPSINRGRLYKIFLPYFEYAEQEKISDILSKLDEAISQSEALVRKYQYIKQGLMSDLLTDKKNWAQMPLGEACAKGGGSIQTGPFGSQLHSGDYKNEGIPIITVEHLGDNEIIHSNLPLVGVEDYKRLERYKIIEGDLVFSRVGAIDRCAYVSARENNWLFSGRCLRVRPGKIFDAKFLSYQLNSYDCRQWILNNSVGSTMKCLNTSILSGLPVFIPKIEEQEKIALILTGTDKTIKTEQSELSKLALLKQGLMQDLLSGQVRVVDS